FRSWVGEYMTSLDMAGFSITLLKLNKELEQLLLSESDTPAFRV
nr:dihydroxyacetone kinase subunit DhaK [Bacillota bacterium]